MLKLNQNEILGAAITVLKERVIQAREDYSKAHEISKDNYEQSVLMASIEEYNKVVEACDKAIGPAKVGDFDVAKTAADEADLSVSRADAYNTENPNLKHVNLNLKIASKNTVAIAIKALSNPGAQSEN